jgi:hypothetical protein
MKLDPELTELPVAMVEAQGSDRTFTKAVQ